MIRIENVSKWYGDFQVLKNCSTSVKKGEVVVICGPSGSGKSTLIKTVNGLEDFQEGTIYVNNINIGDPHTNLPKLRAHVGMVFQHFELFPHLTIRDNLTLAQMKVLNQDKRTALLTFTFLSVKAGAFSACFIRILILRKLRMLTRTR